MAPSDNPEGDSAPSEALFLYGLVMMIVGSLVFSDAEHNSASLKSLFVTNGAAILSFACAAAIRKHGKIKKGDAGWTEYMIGIHFALLVPTGYSALCAWTIFDAWGVPDKQYAIKYMAFKVLAGLVCLVLLVRARKQNKPADSSRGNDTSKGAGVEGQATAAETNPKRATVRKRKGAKAATPGSS